MYNEALPAASRMTDPMSPFGYKSPPSPAGKPGQNRLAWTLNMAINPLTVSPVLMGFITAHAGGHAHTVAKVVLMACAGYIALPTALLVMRGRRGRIDSIEARNQSTRPRVLLQGAVLLLIAGWMCWSVAADTQRSVALVAMVLPLHVVLAAWITPRMKVSLHVACLSGALSLLLMLAWLRGHPMPFTPWIQGILLFLLPIIMWARTADGAHSRAETVAGLFFGLLPPPIILWILDAAWIPS